MTWEIAFVLLLITGALLCFLNEKLPPDVTALLLFVILLVSNVVPQARVFSVLANPAPLTVGAMFILSAALVKCGAIDRLAAHLGRLAGLHYFTLIALVVLGVTVDRVSMEQRWSVDQKCWRPVRLAIKRLGLIDSPAPFDIKILDRCIP